MLQRMLAPLDGTDLAEKAFPYVVQLTGNLNLETTLLHVCDSNKSIFMCEAYISQLVQKLTAQLQKYKPGVTDKGNIQGIIKDGDIVNLILKTSEQSKSDIILMSKNSHLEKSRRLIGNTTHKVLAGTKIPILIIQPDKSKLNLKDEWPKNILVPLDGSRLSDEVLPMVETLSKQMGHRPKITLLNVCESPELNADYPEAIMKLTWEEHVKRAMANSTRVCSMHLEDVQQQLKAKKIMVKTHIILGASAVDEIVKYSNENPFDLIAMTTHGRSGISVWPYGHVVDHLVTLLSIPLLLVRPS